MEMRFFLLFLIILITTKSIDCTTNFGFSGSINCGLNQGNEWCFKLTVNEVDPGKDEKIGEFQNCTTAPKIQYSMKGTANGDGFLYQFYEIRYNLEHNCAGLQDEVRFKVFKVPTRIRAKHLRKNIDLRRLMH